MRRQLSRPEVPRIRRRDSVRSETQQNVSAEDAGSSGVVGATHDGNDDSQVSESEPLLARKSYLEDDAPELSTFRSYFTILTLTLITTVGSMSTGVLNISIPRIQQDLHLSPGFALWPASMFSLVCGCSLFPAGSISDFVGARIVNLSGTLILGLSLLAAGFCQTGAQIIVARGVQGLGVSLCYPSAISFLSRTFPSGSLRPVAFACFGIGQPLGFCLGLILGGVLDEVYDGWRPGYYLSGGIVLFLTIANTLLLPAKRASSESITVQNLWRDIDWIGVLISSACLGILSYILAILTDDVARLKAPENIALLIISISLMPVFVIWMHYQEKAGKTALVPNSIWKHSEFTCICIMVLLAWGVIESMDVFFSLFYQTVQHLSALEASVRFIPSAIVGLVSYLLVGHDLIHRFHNGRLTVFLSFLAIGGPLLMAIIDPTWSYWRDAFWAHMLEPLACCVIFTVANLITTKVFTEETQGIAGSVFNTLSQVGASIGIATMALVDSLAQKLQKDPPADETELLMIGYRSVFWTCTTLMVIVCLVGAVGLRRLGKSQ